MNNSAGQYRKRIVQWTAGAILACALAVNATAQQTKEIQISVGEATILKVADVTKLAIAEPNIADVVAISSTEISIIGKKVGSTTLTISSADKPALIYHVEVANDAVGAVLRQIVPGQPGLTVRSVGESIILDGTVDDELQFARATAVAGAFKSQVINLLEVRRPRQVRIRTRVAEVQRQISRQIGLQWFGDAGTVRYAMDMAMTRGSSGQKLFSVIQGTVGPAASSSTGVQTPLQQDLGMEALLQLLETKGYARVLSEPTLTTMSGKEASFLVGSEIPIVQQLPQSFTIEYKQIGVLMKIKPTVDSHNQILTAIHAELSSVNSTIPTAIGNTLFVIDSKKADTTLQLNDRQTIVIGGLLDNTISPDVIRKVPWLAEIPVLGLLFRHKSSQRQETEVLFFMTPEIVKDIDSETARAARTPAMREWNDRKGTEGVLPAPMPDRNDDWGLHYPDSVGFPMHDEVTPTEGVQTKPSHQEPTTNYAPRPKE